MKKSKILWLALLAAFCVILERLGAQLADFPFQVKPNWFTIVPALLLFAAFLAMAIRRALATAKNPEQTANSGLAEVLPLA